MSKILLSFAMLSSVGLILGCGGGDEGPTLYTVSGTVTKGDQPLKNVIVTFTPTDSTQFPSTGQTDDAGKFSLTGQKSEGAVAGKHVVTIQEQQDNVADDGGKTGAAPAAPSAPKAPAPSPYADWKKEVEVKAENGQTIDLKL